MDQSTNVNKIPFILVTGFLGSGKTSLLKHLLAELSGKMRVAIIQNEFSPGKTDSNELRSTNQPFDLLEVNNGSVFCACLLDTFISQLSVFKQKYNPEIIFLEATGLADPISLGQVMQAPELQKHVYLAGVWTVVDSENFDKSHQFIQQVKHQIQLADLILINKTDLQRPKKQLLALIQRWNPSAEVTETKFSTINNIGQKIHPTSLKKSDSEFNRSASKRPDIGSCVIRTQKSYTKEIIKEFWTSHKNQIHRMKGYAKLKDGQYILIQSVFDMLELTETTQWIGPTEIIFIGPGLQAKEFSKLFLNLV